MKNVEDEEQGEHKPQGNDNTLTPAGPLPSDKVHEVEAGKKVHRNADGTYTIIPITRPSEDEPSQCEDSQKQTNSQDDPVKEDHNG